MGSAEVVKALLRKGADMNQLNEVFAKIVVITSENQSYSSFARGDRS